MLLLSCTALTQAASSVDLAVKGVITPSACTPLLSSSGVVELGKIAASDISMGGMTYLPAVPMDIEVDYSAPTLFALAPHDNRPQMYTPWAFGFAPAAEGKPMGGYWLDFVDAQADGVTPTRFYSIDNGQSWRRASEGEQIEPRRLEAFGGLQPIGLLPFQNVRVSILVSPFFYPGSSWLAANEEMPVDGSTTFEVRYL